MNSPRFEKCLDITLKHEGGYVDHPRDPGGATNKGITHITLADWRGQKVTKTDVRNIQMAEVRAIYKHKYWDEMNCERLFPGVDLATFDAGVNSGVGRGRAWLMASLDRNDDHIQTIRNMISKRTSFLQGLKTFVTFGRGWMRRVADIEARSIQMAAAAIAQFPAPIVKAEYEKTRDETKRDGTVAAGSGTAGGAGSVGTVQSGVTDTAVNSYQTLVVGILFLAIFAVAGYFAWRWWVNRQRSKAQKAVLEEVTNEQFSV